MLNLALLLLAFAAGIYLLIKANQLFLPKIYSALIVLEIVISMGGIGVMAYKGFRHHDGHQCHDKKECRVEKQVIIKDGEEVVNTTETHCSMGCKVEGDSVVMDKAMCEKMMGKEACDAMNKERGRCIMSKEECSKMCHAAGKPCCAESGAGMPAACATHQPGCKGDCGGKCAAQCEKKCESAKKECCSKK